MALKYRQGDEYPAWVAYVTINGVEQNFSTGWTFTVCYGKAGETTKTKTTGITGDSSSYITTEWALGDLDINEGTWLIQLTAKKTSGSREVTVADTLEISSRFLADV